MRATPRPMLSGGPRDRDEELAARVLGFVLEAGDAAEQPQGDAFDSLAAALRHERVRELVGEDRGEEQGGGEDGGRPVRPAGIGLEVGEHARGEGVGEQAADEQQAPVDTDLDAADAAEADGRGQTRVLSGLALQRCHVRARSESSSSLRGPLGPRTTSKLRFARAPRAAHDTCAAISSPQGAP